MDKNAKEKCLVGDQCLVLDTNILLIDAHNLLTLSDGMQVALPETVLEEMDSKKSLLNELGYQAREFGRLLARAEIVDINQKDDATITEMSLDGHTLLVVSLKNYIGERGSDSYNDQKIIQVAQYMDKENDVTFMSNDVMCRLRALSTGLTCSDFKVVEDADFSFIKELDVDFDIFAKLDNADITTIDPDYSTEFYSYKFKNGDSGQVKLATIANNRISVIDKDIEKDLRAQDINPMNAEQLLFSKAIQDPNIGIIVSEAKAGSGKTAIALSNAIQLVSKHKNAQSYRNIIYIRNSIDDVDRGEDIGYLAGNEEKLNVYLHPLHDTLDYIIRNKYKASRETGQQLEDKIEEGIEKLVEDCGIEGMIALGLRGRTFNDSVIIVDEAQNMSKSTLQKILTRIGKNCKVIIVGSNRQIDNAYLTKYTNGLSTVLDGCKRHHDGIQLFAIQLQKVLRGPIAEFAEAIFSGEG